MFILLPNDTDIMH